MEFQQWASPELAKLLPLDEESRIEIITYAQTLPESQAAEHLRNLLGDSPQALEFISSFNAKRPDFSAAREAHHNEKSHMHNDNPMSHTSQGQSSMDTKVPAYAPPAHPPPSNSSVPAYAPPAHPPPSSSVSAALRRPHTNAVIEAAHVRAKDEQDMQNHLQSLQFKYRIYNSDIEPEHDTEYYCPCDIHSYKRRKMARLVVQEMWSKAVMYPGEKAYHDCYQQTFFSNNPYRFRVVSPYGPNGATTWGPQRPSSRYHAMNVQQTIKLNAALNAEAQTSIDAKEPKINIWDDDLESSMSNMTIDRDAKRSLEKGSSNKRQSTDDSPPSYPDEKGSDEKRHSVAGASHPNGATERPPAARGKSSRFGGFGKLIGINPEKRAAAKTSKMIDRNRELRNAILAEEDGRWPDEAWRQMVAVYQEKVGMTRKIADLRVRQPTQYLHLLRAGYFEPIPVAWANLDSNPLKFSIEAAAGWRGITPSWRGFEDTAEERLYWVLNHREGIAGVRLKPDFISEMNMARARMALAVEPPPEYFSPNDTCHLQHTSEGYSKQVMPSPFRAFDRPEVPTDDTMILLDVSGSMDFDPLRPDYSEYLITGYTRSTQPKNKTVAKAIIRRFTDAMANHDHDFQGYDLVTFSSRANYIGSINHRNLEAMWSTVRIGGGTRVMTGWQKVKERHFEKHSESATHHPVYGWQAGPETPMLRLLLLLDGEAQDMDEFELDLLGLSWAHVTIFLIGVDGCPHHHRHANELQRISDVNHHVSFVDAQGNTPERFVTHELLKRHLGYAVSMQEFEQMEELPPYSE
ncbi:hypothetical protein MBLNU459_g3807t1 [Dothideomycetes sp. NU459]